MVHSNTVFAQLLKLVPRHQFELLAKAHHIGRRFRKTSGVNEQQPSELYVALFGRLYRRYQQNAPQHRFRFKNPMCSIDSSLIDLPLRLFPWGHILPRTLVNRVVLQMDRTKSENQRPSWHQQECCHDPNLDRPVRLQNKNNGT